jgi:hypothetical protein
VSGQCADLLGPSADPDQSRTVTLTPPSLRQWTRQLWWPDRDVSEDGYRDERA